MLRQLPRGGAERRAIEAGEIDAVIDYGSANVIVFPAARRALRDTAQRAAAAERKATLELPQRNSMLAALPRSEYRRLLPALEAFRLELGDVLHEAGAPIRHVYFPVDCVVCLLTKIDDQRTVATGLVGHEGMVGMPLALEVGVSSVRAEVQVAGTALRMPATRFTNEFQRGLQLQRQLYRYAQVKLDQARQIAACYASHPFEQRLACWLLMIGDRVESPEMFMTQEHLAAVLNVRRVSVTLACGSLRSRGLIGHSRGTISILDRKGLESASCACYRPIEAADAA
ncbi:MAG: Crp/Fnr family transcriptional regulator [Rubrivivax sp.]